MKARTGETTVNVNVRGVIFTGRPLPQAELHAFLDKNTVDGGPGKSAKQDFNAFTADCFNFRVMAWSGDFTGSDGKPLECNEANKRAICNYDKQLCDEILEALNAAIKNREDVSGKN